MLVLKQMIPQKKALIFSFKFDTLKKTVAQKWSPRDLIEGKKSKTLRAPIKFNKSI